MKAPERTLRLGIVTEHARALIVRHVKGKLALKEPCQSTITRSPVPGLAVIVPRALSRITDTSTPRFSNGRSCSCTKAAFIAIRLNRYGADANIDGGARFLRQMLDRFGTVHLAVVAYNAGPNAIARARGIPLNGETPAYVAKVMHRWILAGPEVN